MEASETPSYICLVKDTDLSGYSEDELNIIHSEFMKDQQKLKGIVECSSYFFEMYIHMIRRKKWKEVEECRMGAQGECEMLFTFLVKNGLKTDHQQNQGSDPRTQRNSDLNSTSRDQSPKEAAPDEKETNQADVNESDLKEDTTRISSSVRTVPHNAGKAHTPGSVTDEGTERVYDSNPRVAPETAKDNRTADETNRSRDLLRRSEEASLLLRNGNPNIPDLSDANRPTKLAERFSELYSNEYMDAFEFLQEQGQDEEHIVYDLLRIVRYAYTYCRQKASEELTKRIHNILQERMASNEFRNDDKEDIMVKGLAAKKLKMDAPGLKDDVCKTFAQKNFWKLIPKEIDPTNEKLVTYALNCVDIVWFMCVQDPLISMSWVEKGDTFDTSLYRAYTTTGTKVDFCVWPLVLLADSGPVLTKGIAQGK